MSMTNAERQQVYRHNQRQSLITNNNYKPRGWKGKSQSQPYNRGPKARCYPFVGCDGEGGSSDEQGRQNFYLFRIGDRELETGQHLTTEECLEFICEAPEKAILVGFYFGYDTSQILRGLPKSKLDRIFKPFDEFNPNGRMRWTYHRDYGIRYLPKQFLSICRLDKTGKPIPRTTRTIYETGGFFQGSFIKQLDAFSIGTEQERDLIRTMKGERGEFTIITPEIRYYNELECRLLAELMESFRTSCIETDIVPRTWNGAGKLASALHSTKATIPRTEVLKIVPKHCLELSHNAYYGGRFEVTSIGKIEGPIYEYDIGSAYPDAMRNLPCLTHGRWVPFGNEGPSDSSSLFVASVLFTHTKTQNLYGIPIRDKSGTIYWPKTGNGTYWSVELNSAAKLGCMWKYQEGYEYVKTCSCQMFSWVHDLYCYRKSIGKSGKGYPIKLGLNSLYGKLAQRIGNPRYGNFLYAGLITALCRAKLNEAIAHDPDAIVMLATDGVYSTRPLPLTLGSDLGEWEQEVFDNIFIVKPGLYWTPDKIKTRGVNKKDVDDNKKVFEETWHSFATSETNRKNGAASAPIIPIATRLFVGLKLAYARGKPETAGKWQSCICSDEQKRNKIISLDCNAHRKISFDWSLKRQVIPRWQGGAALTKPFLGSKELRSVIYKDVEDVATELDFKRSELDDMPDGGSTIDHVLGEKVIH